VIKVDFPEPRSELWARWKARAEAAQRQHSPGADLNDSVYRAVRRWLLLAFARKCAYCERSIRGHAVRVDHFRPKRGIRRLGGEAVVLRAKPAHHPGYHFLVYDWRNLLPSCEQCNLAKSNLFHTADGWWAEGHPELEREKPLLVHPVREDPQGLLRFERDGHVYPGARDDARARYVIQTLDLNREELINDRAEAWELTELEMESLLLWTRAPRPDQERLFNRAAERFRTIKRGLAEFTALKRLAILPGEKALQDEWAEQERRRRTLLGAAGAAQPMVRAP